MIIMMLLSVDGCWLRILPEVVYREDSNARGGYFFNHLQPLTWARDLPVMNSLALCEYLQEERDGGSLPVKPITCSSRVKTTTCIDGINVYISKGTMVMFPASLHYSSNIRMARNGNERLQSFAFWECRGAKRSIHSIISNEPLIHYVTNNLLESPIQLPAHPDSNKGIDDNFTDASSSNEDCDNRQYKRRLNADIRKTTYGCQRGVRHFGRHFMM
jgi:hypothetical protein